MCVHGLLRTERDGNGNPFSMSGLQHPHGRRQGRGIEDPAAVPLSECLISRPCSLHDKLYFGKWRKMDANPNEIKRAYAKLGQLLPKVEEISRKENSMQARLDVRKACDALAMANPEDEPYASVKGARRGGRGRLLPEERPDPPRGRHVVEDALQDGQDRDPQQQPHPPTQPAGRRAGPPSRRSRSAAPLRPPASASGSFAATMWSTVTEATMSRKGPPTRSRRGRRRRPGTARAAGRGTVRCSASRSGSRGRRGRESPTSRKTSTVATARMRVITAFPRRNFRIICSMSRRITPTIAWCFSGKSPRVRRVSGSGPRG